MTESERDQVRPMSSAAATPDDQLDHPIQTKRGVAALAACIVRTLADRDETFLQRFEQHLDADYATLKAEGQIGAMEVLFWTRLFLKKP